MVVRLRGMSSASLASSVLGEYLGGLQSKWKTGSSSPAVLTKSVELQSEDPDKVGQCGGLTLNLIVMSSDE